MPVLGVVSDAHRRSVRRYDGDRGTAGVADPGLYDVGALGDDQSRGVRAVVHDPLGTVVNLGHGIALGGHASILRHGTVGRIGQTERHE